MTKNKNTDKTMIVYHGTDSKSANSRTAGVLDMNFLYEKAVGSIKLILKNRYKMNAVNAERAITISPLKTLFEQNADMAAHTSNETWARYVYDYWKLKMDKTEN